MTYSIDYRKKVLSSIDNGLTVREAATFYAISTSTIHSWRENLEPRKWRDKAPTKIPDDYQYERANRLGCSKTDIHHTLKRLNISQKEDTRTSKGLSDKKS